MMGGAATLDVVDDLEDFSALREQWDAAVAASHDPNPFLTHEWLATWWDHFGHDAELHVVRISDADGIVALAPLARHRVGMRPLGSSVLRPVSYNAGDYGGVVIVRRATEAVKLLVEHLREEVVRHRSVALLTRIRDDTTFCEEFRQQVARDASLVAVSVPLDDSTWSVQLSDDFDLATLARHERVEKKLGKLRSTFGVTFEHHAGDDFRAGLDEFLRLYELRWAEHRASMTGLLSRPDTERFTHAALTALADRGWARVVTLNIDSRAIAAAVNVEYDGRVYRFKTAYDPELRRFSPGKLLTWHAFADAIERGFTVYDFLRGDDEYKRHWADHRSRLLAFTLSRPGLAGRLDRERLRVARRLEHELQVRGVSRHDASTRRRR